MTMEGGILEHLFQSMQEFEAKAEETRQQQHRDAWYSIGKLVALIDLPVSLPVSISSVKKRKASTQYFQPDEAEQYRDENGKENVSGAVPHSAQLKSSKASGRKTRRKKPLADSQADNQARQLETSMEANVTNEEKMDVGLDLGQKGNEQVIPSLKENKGTPLSNKENEELVHSPVGNERMPFKGADELVKSTRGTKSTAVSVTRKKEGSKRKSMSISGVRISVGESVPNLGKSSDDPPSNAVSVRGAEPSQVKTEVPDLNAPMMTRARARNLQNAGGNVTITRGEPPIKKRKAPRPNPRSSSAAKKDGTAVKMQTVVAQTFLEQREQERPPSIRSVQKNDRGSADCTPLTDGNVGKKEALGKEQDLNAGSVCNSPARKEAVVSNTQAVIAQVPLERVEVAGERLTSRRSVAVQRDSDGSSRSPPQMDRTVEKKDALVEERGVHPISVGKFPAGKDEAVGKMQTIAGGTPLEQQRSPSTCRAVGNARGYSHSPQHAAGQQGGIVGNKEAFVKEQDITVSSICSSPARKEETPGRTEAIVDRIPLEQQEGTRLASRIAVAVKGNTRGRSRSPPHTDEIVEEKESFCEELDVKPNSACISPAEDDEAANIMQTFVSPTPLEQHRDERQLSVRPLKRNTRSNLHSRPQTAGNPGEKEQDTNLSSLSRQEQEAAGKMQLIFTQTLLPQPERGRPPSVKSARRNARGSLCSPRGNVGDSEEQELNCSAPGSASARKEETPGKIFPHVAQPALGQQNRDSLAKTVNVDVADLVGVDAMTVKSKAVEDATDLPSGCLASSEELSILKPVLHDSTDTDSKLISVLSSPLLREQCLERDVDMIASDQTELKTEDKCSILDVHTVETVEQERGALAERIASDQTELNTEDKCSILDVHTEETVEQERGALGERIASDQTELKTEDKCSILDVHAEETVEQDRGALRERTYLEGFSNSLAEKKEHSGGKLRIAPPSSAVELEMKENRKDGILPGSAHLQPLLMNPASQSIEKRKDRLQMLSIGHSVVGVSPRRRNCAIVDRGEIQNTPLAPGLLKDDLSGQVTDRTPARKKKLLLSIIKDRTPARTAKLFESLTPNVPREELIDGETAAVVPGRLELKMHEINHLLKTSGRRRVERGSVLSDVADEWAGNLKRIIRPDLDVNSSLEQLHTKETAASRDDWQTNDSLMLSSVEKCDGKMLLEKVQNTPLGADVSNVERGTASSPTKRHRADGVEVQRYANLSSNLGQESKVFAGGMLVERLPVREGCAQTQGRAGEELGSFVALLEQASASSQALGPSVRECGANAGGPPLNIPVTKWRSESFRSMMGVSAQCLPRVLGPASQLTDGTKVQKVPEFKSPKDRKPVTEERANKPSSVLIQEEDQDKDQDQETQDTFCALGSSGMVDCSHKIDGYFPAALEGDCTADKQRLSHEEVLNISKSTSLPRSEEGSAISSLLLRTEDDGLRVPDSFCYPIGSVDSLQQIVSSNIDDVPKPSSNLISSMKSFVPVAQPPPPSFFPDGKKFVKVKALLAAEALRRAEENGDAKDRQRKKKKDVVETGLPLQESADGCKVDGEISCVSILSPRRKVLGRDRSKSRSIFSPEAKSKQATNLEIERKVKKNQAELKRMEEERRRKLMATRETKEQAVKQNRQKQERLKHRRDQKRMGADLEDKGQTQQSAGQEILQAQKNKGEALEEKASDPVAGVPLVARPIVEGQGQKIRPGHARPVRTTGKILSNQPRTLSLRSAVRVPIVSKDKWPLQQKDRNLSSLSSSSRLRSSNAESAYGVREYSTNTFSLDNRTTNVRQGESVESVSCFATPSARAVEQEEDMGPTSYEISPYRDSSDDEEDDPRNHAEKHIPFWALKENLNPQLLKLVNIDPDEIFISSKTCSLQEIFGRTGSKKIKDFGKRSDSGDWFKDRVSWKEELQYKIAMRYETNSMQPKKPL